MVATYLESRPDPAIYGFLQDDFDALISRFGGVVGTTFRTFPSFPQRYIERLPKQMPCEADTGGVDVEPLRVTHQPPQYTEDDLHMREFSRSAARRVIRKGAFRAA